MTKTQQATTANLEQNSVTAATKEFYLRRYGLKCILSMSKIVRWMHIVGFRYQNRAKHYFVDGHEKATTLEYRPAYTKRYLDLEVQAHRWIQSHRWIQFSIDESKILEVQGYVSKDTGYHYSGSGVDMVEYHVDNVGKMPDVQYGGKKLSVRRSLDDPVVFFPAKMRPSSSNYSCYLRCGLDLMVRDHFYLEMRVPV